MANEPGKKNRQDIAATGKKLPLPPVIAEFMRV